MVIDTSRNGRDTALIETAGESFGESPRWLVRAPGRVNLIGEHTDYNGLPVIPIAIDRDVRMAVSPRSDKLVCLRNLSAFGSREFALEARIPPYPPGDWGNYVKAAAQGLREYCGERLRQGADVVVDGNVPSGAGLSSSSALVVASALALLAANDIEIAFTELAELLPRAERYVGTMSGGMDQTISLLAQRRKALRIDFFPVRCRPVALPDNVSILVCDSLVPAEKSGAAKAAYNQRVLECRLGCYALSRALGLHDPLVRLGDLVTRFPERSLEEYVSLLTRTLPEDPLRLVDIADAFGAPVAEVEAACAIHADEARYVVTKRVRHVLAEAERVDRAEEVLKVGDAHAFGALMNASHQSCAADYDISCADLDELVEIARGAGAIGARLTGAGFGGCTVSLVPNQQVQSVIEALDRGFYATRPRPRPLDDLRLVVEPVAGASVIPLDGRDLR